MEGSPHKHKRTIAQDFLTKSLTPSTELNLSLNRHSFTTEYSGPLTLRVTHIPGPEENLFDKMKKSSIQERPSTKTISNLKSNLLHLQQKLSEAARHLNSPSSRPPSTDLRSTIGGKPSQMERILFVCNEVSEDESTLNMESQKLLIMKSRERLAVSQYGGRYYTGHLLKALVDNFPQGGLHLSEMITAMKKAMVVRVPSQIEIQRQKVILTSPPHPNRKTLFLQLDHTLLCRRQKQIDENDIAIGSGKDKFYVSLRPYLFSFLKKIKQYYELIIFSSLEREIVKQILDDIDPDGRLLSDCFTKEHCLTLKGDLLCKDIRIFNRNLKQMAIIDSNPKSTILHPDNYIPILPYNGSTEDRQLMQLQRFLLKELSPSHDIREVLRERFKLNRYWQYQDWQSLIRELYLD